HLRHWPATLAQGAEPPGTPRTGNRSDGSFRSRPAQDTTTSPPCVSGDRRSAASPVARSVGPRGRGGCPLLATCRQLRLGPRWWPGGTTPRNPPIPDPRSRDPPTPETPWSAGSLPGIGIGADEAFVLLADRAGHVQSGPAGLRRTTRRRRSCFL